MGRKINLFKEIRPNPGEKILIYATGICYILFISIDFIEFNPFNLSAKLKYLSIWICFGITLFRFFSINRPGCSMEKKIGWINITAFFFTLSADYFLLFTEQYGLGITLFCGVHIARSYLFSTLKKRTEIIFWEAFFASLIFFVCRSFIIAIASFYGFLILTVTMMSFRKLTFLADRYPVSKYLLRFGMILFCLCDICVAVYNFPGSSYFISRLSGFLIWFFYLPAQLLLSFLIPPPLSK